MLNKNYFICCIIHEPILNYNIFVDKSKVRTPSPPPPTSSSGAASEDDDDDDYNEARYRESKIPRMRMYADDESQIPMRKRLNSSSNSRLE